MRLPIYLDNNATTRVDPRALETLLPYLGERYGNASSRTHRFGWEADEAVQEARRTVAALIQARPAEVIFTSGATEANNLAILGAARARAAQGRHLVTSTIEHQAVLDPMQALEREGFTVTRLRPDRTGRVAVEKVAEALRPDTVLVSFMLANNELGTLNPIAEISALARARGALVHTDAAQGVGKVPVDVQALGVDLLSIAGHKFHAPKGVGALFVRGPNPRAVLAPLQFGGGQEHGLRPGTLNVPLIVGLGAACRVAQEELPAESQRIRGLADTLWTGLQAALPGVHRNGNPAAGLPGTVSVAFEGIESEALLLALPDLAASSGAACSSRKVDASHVLREVGLGDLAQRTVRFSVGRFNTEEEILVAIDRVVDAVRRLRR